MKMKMNQNTKKTVLSIRLRPQTIELLNTAAQQLGYSRSDFIRKCIEQGLSQVFFNQDNSHKNSYSALQLQAQPVLT